MQLDLICLLVSLACLAAGVLLMLFPKELIQFSKTLEKRSAPPLDEQLLRYPALRYVMSLMAFAVCLGMFRLAWLLPLFRD